MYFTLPKNTEKYEWTRHAAHKLRQYGLSAQRVIRVIRNPERTEEGIVPRTVACMQKSSSNKKSGEIWCMYQIKISNFQFPISNKIPKSTLSSDRVPRRMTGQILNSANRKIRIISAWRYPGVSPKKDPIPEEILREIQNII